MEILPLGWSHPESAGPWSQSGLGKSASPQPAGNEPAWLPRVGQPLLAFLKSAAIAARWAFQVGKRVQ